MLKRIISYFNKTYPINPIDIVSKNKLRFQKIHADKRFNSLQRVYERLIERDEMLTNDEILENYSKFSKKIQTNSIAAAELELVSISTLCYYRPELTNQLMRTGLLAVVSSMGDNINFDDVLDFINYRILAKNAEPYGGWPQEEGVKWLSDILPASRVSIQEVLIDVINKNREEIDSM